MEIRKVSLLNKTIYLFSNTNDIAQYLKSQDRGILISLNVEAMASTDNEFTRIINGNIGYIDGVGLLIPLRIKGHSNLKKIPGIDLWQIILKKFPEKNVFLIGATEEVIETVVKKFPRDFSNKLIGYRNGYFSSQQEIRELKEKITLMKPDIVLIALGQPTQEKLADELMALNPAIYICIGGSFDIYAGLKKRAPKILISIGAEWLYRLCKEPWRFSRIFRSLKAIPRMILAKQKYLS